MKIGDYVRTKKGDIGKVMYINQDNTAITTDYDINPNIAKCVHINHIIKSSPDILDLIKVGDYVNGSKVQEIGKDYVEIEEYSGLNNDMPCIVKTKDIKSIVTKEQFENMEYKVGE